MSVSGDNIPRISLNAPIPEANNNMGFDFIGEIVVDEFQPRAEKFGGGYQWVLAVKPLNRKIGGKTGAFHEYVAIKEIKANNKLGLMVAALQNVLDDGEEASIGEGDLIGKIAVFRKETRVYGTAKDGTEYKGSLLLAQRRPTLEELESLGLAAEAKKAAFEWTDENVETALSILEGKKKNQFQRAAFAAKLDDVTLTQMLVSGDAAEYLVNNGLAEYDDEGKLVRA